MQNSDARMVRGISIAVIVLAGLSIAVFLLGVVALVAVGAFASDPSLYGNGISIEGYHHGYYDSLSPEATASIVGASLGIAVAFLIWFLLCSVVTLIAGIMGLRNHDKPEKLGGVFGWTIAGAVAAFLSGRIITTVLLVVSAVYVNKLRHPVQPMAYPQPGYYVPQPQPYAGQPGYGQPYQGQPYAGQPYPPQAPQQPQAPQPPQAPQQPVPPAPPEQQ